MQQNFLKADSLPNRGWVHLMLNLFKVDGAPKWHIVYYILAGIDLLTVGCMLGGIDIHRSQIIAAAR